MTGRRSETATERLARRRRRIKHGERLLAWYLPMDTMDLDELRSIKSAYNRRIVNSRAGVRHLDPGCPQRTAMENEIALSGNIIRWHIDPLLTAELHNQVEQIIVEHRNALVTPKHLANESLLAAAPKLLEAAWAGVAYRIELAKYKDNPNTNRGNAVDVLFERWTNLSRAAIVKAKQPIESEGTKPCQ